MKKQWVQILSAIMIGAMVCVPVYAIDTGFCVGVDYQDANRVNTETIAYNAFYNLLQCGIESGYNYKPRPYTLESNLDNTVLIYSGHGQFDHIGFNYYGSPLPAACIYAGSNGQILTTNKGVTYKCTGIGDHVFKNTKLAVFAGCLTSDASKSKSSTLPYVACMNGVQCAVGWKYKVNLTSLEDWMQNFGDELANNRTVADAVKLANQEGYYDDRVKDVNIAGRSSIRLTYEEYSLNEENLPSAYEVREDGEWVSVPIIESEEEKDVGDVNFRSVTISPNEELEFNFQNPDIEKLVQYLKENINPDFYLEDYRILYHDNSAFEDGKDGVIDFIYMMNGFETDVSYVFIIDNGKAELLGINNEPIKKDLILPRSGLPDEETLEQMAVQYHALPEDSYCVKEQTIKKYYETETNSAFYLVFTDYVTDLDGVISLQYKYPIVIR